MVSAAAVVVVLAAAADGDGCGGAIRQLHWSRHGRDFRRYKIVCSGDVRRAIVWRIAIWIIREGIIMIPWIAIICQGFHRRRRFHQDYRRRFPRPP